MTWTPKQIDAAHVARGPHRSPGAPAISDAEVVAIMDSARDALAANGGAMTAEGIRQAFVSLDTGGSPLTSEALAQHTAAQGAKVAALIAWLADLTEALCGERPVGLGVMPGTTLEAARALKAKVAALEAELAATEAERKRLSELASVTECLAARRERDEARAALDRNERADLQLRRDLGATESETLRGAAMRVKKDLDEANTALADHSGCLTRLSVVLGCVSSFAEVEAGVAELARLKPSGQVAEDAEAVHERLRGADWDEDDLAFTALSRLAANAQRWQEATSSLEALRLCVTKASAELRHAYRPETRDWNLVARAIRILEEVTTPNAPHHPCSPTCTAHDGGGKTLAGVREQGGTLPNDAPGRVVYEAGAEDMRAACLEASQEWWQAEGLDHAMYLRLKAAIEGAQP